MQHAKHSTDATHRREAQISAGHGQAVRLTDSRAHNHVGGEPHVLDEAPDHDALQGVLLAEEDLQPAGNGLSRSTRRP